MSSVIISGDVSGTVTLQAPSAAGSTVVTLPSTSMNMGNGGGSVASNTAFGTSALAANTSGSQNNAFGVQALQSNTTGAVNTALGDYAMRFNTTGNLNTASGSEAAYKNTTGSYNTAYGAFSLHENTTASYSTAVGYQAANNATAGDVVAVGYNALYATTSGVYNTAVGPRDAGGTSVMRYNTTGSYNTAVGGGALASNTTGQYLTAVGYGAGYSSDTGWQNTFVGANSGRLTTGQYNAFLGQDSGYNATGSSNTFIGMNSGSAVTTGAKNTILGRYTGNQGGLDFRTTSNNIVLSDGDGNARGYYNGSANLWAFNNGGTAEVVSGFYNSNASTPYGLYVSFSASTPNNTSSYFLGCNDSAVACFRIWSNGTTSGRSDERLKKNITPANSQLADVMAMEVVNYEWKESIGGTKEIGWVAQQVQQIKPNIVQENDDGFLHLKREPMVAILWKAVQELKAQVDAQAAEIATLKGQQ